MVNFKVKSQSEIVNVSEKINNVYTFSKNDFGKLSQKLHSALFLYKPIEFKIFQFHANGVQ